MHHQPIGIEVMHLFAHRRRLKDRVRPPQPGQPGAFRSGDPAGQPGGGQRIAQRGVGVQRRHVHAGQRRRQRGSGEVLKHDPIVQVFDDN